MRSFESFAIYSISLEFSRRETGRFILFCLVLWRTTSDEIDTLVCHTHSLGLTQFHLRNLRLPFRWVKIGDVKVTRGSRSRGQNYYNIVSISRTISLKILIKHNNIVELL